MPLTANEITAELLIRIPKEIPGARVWRNNRVDVMVAGRGGKSRRVKAGIDGQADITGVLPGGIRCECEVKAPGDKMSEAQENFRDMILRAGGIYIVARDVERAIADLKSYA